MPSESVKVLHVVSSLDPRAGGPVEALRGLTLALRGFGVDVRILATWQRGDDLRVAESLKAAGIGVRLIGPCWNTPRWSFDLARITREEVAKADVIHIHALWEEVQHQAARSARQLGRPYIFAPHGMLDPWSLRQGRWKKSLYLLWRLRGHLQNASALHFTAKLEGELTAPLKLSVPSIVEPNGIDGAEYERLPPRGSFRERRGIPKDARLTLFLGRLHPKKGLDFFLPAYAAAALGADSFLVIAGPGDPRYCSQLQQLVQTLGLEKSVLFTGQLQGTEKLAAFHDADLFVLPSHQENFGIAVIEALAARVPVLISDQVNLHTAISEADAGGVVPLDKEAWTRELRRWLGDEKLRQDAGQRGYMLVRSQFLWPEIAKRWSGHYKRLLGRSDYTDEQTPK